MLHLGVDNCSFVKECIDLLAWLVVAGRIVTLIFMEWPVRGDTPAANTGHKAFHFAVIGLIPSVAALAGGLFGKAPPYLAAFAMEVRPQLVTGMNVFEMHAFSLDASLRLFRHLCYFRLNRGVVRGLLTQCPHAKFRRNRTDSWLHGSALLRLERSASSSKCRSRYNRPQPAKAKVKQMTSIAALLVTSAILTNTDFEINWFRLNISVQLQPIKRINCPTTEPYCAYPTIQMLYR